MGIKEKILKIMELALEIGPPEIPNIGKKKTAVFINWSPHCNWFEVLIIKNGWRQGVDYEESHGKMSIDKK